MTDGFVGNVVLKVCEGVFDFVMKVAGKEILGSLNAEKQLAQQAMANLLKRYDYQEIGGAPLLGVKGMCFITHGSSNGNAIKNAIRVAVDEARDRRVAVLGERVLHHRGEGLLLAAERDDLATDGIVRVVGVDEAREVRRDVDPELVVRGQPGLLLVGEVQDLADFLERVDPMTELPAPVVPLLVGDVRPDRRAPAARGPAVRTEGLRGVAAVDERRLGEGARRVLVRDGGLDLLGVQLDTISWARTVSA